MTDRESAKARKLDDALARARAAFAGKTDDEIMDEVAEVIDEMRAEERRKIVTPASS